MSQTTSLRIRILIVDDDPAISELLRLILAQEGYHVEVARNGEDAYAMATRQPPHLLITDVVLPQMDGYTLCRRLRQSAQTRTLPILMLTSQGDLADKVAGFEAGANDYLTKPFQAVELTYRVKSLMARTPPTMTPTVGVSKRGRIMVIFGARGGVGKTTIGVNMAVALRRRTNKRVLLFDADFFFGSVGVHLNLPSVRSILDLLPHIDELQPDVIERAVSVHSSGLHVLLSPFHPEEAERITSEQIKQLLNYLVGLYDYVIVDCQVSYDDRSLVILERADNILLITAPELTAIITTNLFLELAEKLDLRLENISVVLNRSNSNVGIEAPEIERALRRPITFKVISGGRPVVQSVNRGVPLIIEQPNHPFSQHVALIAEYYSKQPVMS